MLNLLRAGASGVILVLLMLGGGLVLWIGVPMGWLWVGGRVDGATHSIGLALLTMLLGVAASIAVIVPTLGWLNVKHNQLREARGLEDHGGVALEGVMTVSAVIAVIAFVIWFFVIEGPGPELAPRQ
jgi:heme/copper-type cytochrome/quinol oxidase subunit 2